MTTGDWTPFGGDPAPGDPQAAALLASIFGDVAATGRQALGALHGVARHADGSIWRGPSADAFGVHLAQTPGAAAADGHLLRDRQPGHGRLRDHAVGPPGTGGRLAAAAASGPSMGRGSPDGQGGRSARALHRLRGRPAQRGERSSGQFCSATSTRSGATARPPRPGAGPGSSRATSKESRTNPGGSTPSTTSRASWVRSSSGQGWSWW